MNVLPLTMPDLASQEFDFARLIAELNAIVGFDDSQLAQVAESMSIETSDVQALIDRAEMVFELAKASLFGGAVQYNYFPATYVSNWDGGVIETSCIINLTNQTIVEIGISESDCNFDHLESEHVSITLNGNTHSIAAEGGSFTNEGKVILAALIAQ